MSNAYESTINFKNYSYIERYQLSVKISHYLG